MTLPACTRNAPVVDRAAFESWYAADSIEEIVLLENRKQAEIHLRDNTDTFYLPYDDLGTFVNDYLAALNRQYPERNVVIRVR